MAGDAGTGVCFAVACAGVAALPCGAFGAARGALSVCGAAVSALLAVGVLTGVVDALSFAAELPSGAAILVAIRGLTEAFDADEIAGAFCVCLVGAGFVAFALSVGGAAFGASGAGDALARR